MQSQTRRMILDRILAGVFGAGVALRNRMYDRAQFAVNRLQAPVVSIGNIGVGGAGKTPFTLFLGGLLKQRGIPFDILSRGYGRATRGAMIVDPKGASRDFGDEPLLIARKLAADVVVGESRYLAGLLAERAWGPRLHLLDDGFQHRRLARQFDIVLVSREDLDDALLPAGRLREPLSSLARANAIVITGDTPTAKLPPNIPVWHLTRELDVEQHPNTRFVAFCGIAKPQTFFSQLRSLGLTLAAEVAFRDHHRYRPSDLVRLDRIAKEQHAGGFITTAKDAINLENVQGFDMWCGHSCLCVAELRLTLANSDAFLNELLANVGLPTPNG
jgi:tetraacyldisaccharide 4'-kinase